MAFPLCNDTVYEVLTTHKVSESTPPGSSAASSLYKVVYDKDTGYLYYKCRVTHTSSTSNSPSDNGTLTTYWEPVSNVGPIYSSLIIAKDASLDFVQGNELLIKDSSGIVCAGLTGGASASAGTTAVRIWAGSRTPGSAPFQVKNDGSLVATQADITGKITATEGTIGGLKIEGNNIGATVEGRGVNFDISGNKFLHINNVGSALISGRNDSGTVASFSAYGTNATALNLLCNSIGVGYAIKSIGDHALIARNSAEKVLISGLALACGTGTSWKGPGNLNESNSSAWIDFLIMNGTTTLPNPVNCYGKILFVFSIGSKTLNAYETDGIRPCNGGAAVSSVNVNGMKFFIAYGSAWYEGYCQ